MSKTFLILSLIAVAGFAQADLRSEIMASRLKQEKASKAKDIKAVEAAMKESITPDFTYVQGGRPQDAKAFIGEFVMSVKMTEKITSSSTRIISLKESGNKGSGEIELSMKGTMKNPDKTIHTMDWTGVFTEESRKVGGKWKMSKMSAGKQKFLVDGKAVNI